MYKQELNYNKQLELITYSISILSSNRGPERRRVVSNESAWMSVAMVSPATFTLLNNLREVEEWMIPVPLSFPNGSRTVWWLLLAWLRLCFTLSPCQYLEWCQLNRDLALATSRSWIDFVLSSPETRMVSGLRNLCWSRFFRRRLELTTAML